MKGPYFITTLEDDVRIHPSEMNNNIIDNIKRSLERTKLNKCYEKYGYIDKIYDIDKNIKDGVIRAEDNTSSSVHRVKFTCRICNPIKNSIIIARITSINNMMIVAENGPLRILINTSNINTDNVQFRRSAFYPISSKGEVINKPIDNGSYVRIRVMNKKLVNKKSNIVVFGRLESAILDDTDAIHKIIRDQYESSEKISANDLQNDKFSKTIDPDDQDFVEKINSEEEDDEESDK